MSDRIEELKEDIATAQQCYDGLEDEIRDLKSNKSRDHSLITEKLSEKLKVGEILHKLKRELEQECIREKNQPSDEDRRKIMEYFYSRNNPGSLIGSAYKVGIEPGKKSVDA
jgi:hypothetical protein